MLSEWRIHVLDSQSFPGFLIEAGTANKIGRLPTECNLLVQNEAPSGKGSVSTPPPPKASPGRLRLVTWFFPGMPSGIPTHPKSEMCQFVVQGFIPAAPTLCPRDKWPMVPVSFHSAREMLLSEPAAERAWPGLGPWRPQVTSLKIKKLTAINRLLIGY